MNLSVVKGPELSPAFRAEPGAVFWAGIESPLGTIYAATSELGLCFVDFGVSRAQFLAAAEKYGTPVPDARANAEAARQLGEYFAQMRRVFDLTLDLHWSTPFQRDVYRTVSDIPYGQTRTYGAVAKLLGRPRAFRAVGAANGQNPLPIVVPCHRLVGSDGRLHGYGAGQGVATKRWLLEFEGAL